MHIPRYLQACLGVLIAASAHAQPEQRDLDAGVTARIYRVEPDLTAIPTLAPDQTPNSDRLIPTIDLAQEGFDGIEAPLVTEVTGWLIIDDPASYEFRLTSDDGSRLLIDGRLIIDHDGRHGATAMDSRPIDLEAGLHALRIDHFDHGGRKRLLLEWRRAGEREFSAVPEAALRTERDLTRVTSPGFKTIEDGRRPGDGKPLDAVHPAWRVETIRPDGFEPMVGAMAFDAKGRLIVGTFNPLQRDEESLPDIESKEPDKLFAVTGYTGGASPEVRVVADGFYEPAGMCAVGEDLYVSHRKAITRLRDLDGDGYFEDRKDVAAGWEGWNYHQFVFGLVHMRGKLYAALSTAMAPPKWEGMGTNAAPNGPMRGGILEVDLSVEDPHHAARIIAGGTRTPNGIGIGPNGTIWYLDNQGTWMPTSQMAQVIPGRFYGHYNRSNFVPNLADRFPDGGHPSIFADRPRTPATLLMSQNEVSNSPTEPVLIEDGLYAGQMLIGELTAGGIRRAHIEKVSGQYQGALFRFTQGLEAGVNRLVWGPDGALYAGGIGAGGNWNWRETKYGLQRLVPTGETTYEIHSVSATPTGFEIYFTKEPDREHLSDLASYIVKQWTYTPTAQYGGPKVDQELLPVTGVRTGLNKTAGSQRLHGVAIDIDGLREDRCVHVRVDPPSKSGEAIWSPEFWYTLNEIPRERPAAPSRLGSLTIDPSETGVGVGVLPPAHSATLIGASADSVFRTSSQSSLPGRGGRSQDDILELPGYVKVGEGSGNIVTSTVFGDCRLHIEWYSPPGGLGQLAGNSGVYLQNLYEIQVLGTKSIAQGGPEQPALNEAGAIYNIRRPDTNASNGPGSWQAYDIWFRAPRFKDGEKVEDARVTVYWNGRLVHHDFAIPRPTGGRAGAGEPGPDGGTGIQTGPLFLQDHASMAEGPVRYRNIWIAPLEPLDYQPADWIDLIDENWAVRGGQAAIAIEDGENGKEIVGRSRPRTPNTFFVTERTFGDFELLLEFKIDDELNGGIQVRSEVAGGFGNRAGGLRGYQVELDPSDRAYTAGIYDELRRAWLRTLIDAPYARRAFRHGEWNRLRILAEGPIVRTWLNGVPAADLFDAMTSEGHIALQVHGVGNREGELEVRFRNLRLRELNPRKLNPRRSPE